MTCEISLPSEILKSTCFLAGFDMFLGHVDFEEIFMDHVWNCLDVFRAGGMFEVCSLPDQF